MSDGRAERAKEIIVGATELLSGKANDYGGPRKAFADVATVASIIRGKEFSSIDVAGILLATKLSRLGNCTRDDAPEVAYDTVLDVVQDAVNYLGLYESLREDKIQGDKVDAIDKAFEKFRD